MKKRFLIPVSLLIPCISLAENVKINVNPLNTNDSTAFIENLVNWLFSFTLVVVPAVIIIGAFMIIVSAGNPERVKTGRNFIIWAIVGLAIVMASKGIIALVYELLT